MRAGLLLLALFLSVGCRGGQPAMKQRESAAAQWRRAQAAWGARPDLTAGYSDFAAIAARRDSSEAQEAERRLRAAAEHYRQAIALIAAGQSGAREALSRGKALAPMDPMLLLPLARACRSRDNAFLAVQYYRSLLAEPTTGDALAGLQRDAGRELGELTKELGDAYGTPAAAPPPPPLWQLRVQTVATLLSGTALGLLLAVGLSALSGRRRRGRSLAELAETYPELQPALSYLIGRLRHELLKHRIGAATDVAQSLATGPSSAEQRVFLHKKLFGGERLDEAWTGYLQSFRRSLGPDFDLLRIDRDFRRAQRAITQLQGLELPLLRGQRGALRRLLSAQRVLVAFDRQLAALVMRLQRTPLDRQLIEQATLSVRSEHLAGQVALDAIELDGPTEPVTVAVYRTDLLLILKNLLRNAILAVGRTDAPRRVAVDVVLELLPTGEEAVKLRVHDSSPEKLTPEQIYRSGDPMGQGAQHGLSLVTAALSLYSGSISVEAGRPGYEKCVVVRLFRALDAGDVGATEAVADADDRSRDGAVEGATS